MKALHNLQLISDGQITIGKAVLISGGSIIDVIEDTAIPSDAQKIDLNSAYLAPGFIDLQIYGSGGKLFADWSSMKNGIRFHRSR